MIRLNHYNRLPQKLPTAPLKIPVTRSQSLPTQTPTNTPIDTPEEVPVTPPTRAKTAPKSKTRGRPKKSNTTASNTEASAVDTHDHQQDLEQL